LSAERVFRTLADGRDSLTLRECQALALDKMVKPDQWEILKKQGGITNAQFIRLFHKFQFVPAMVAAAEASRTPEQLGRMEQGLTSCGVNVHCLSVDEVSSTWPSLGLKSIASAEWQRFGRMTTTKADGWRNAEALIDAFAAQFSKAELKETAPPKQLPPLQEQHKGSSNQQSEEQHKGSSNQLSEERQPQSPTNTHQAQQQQVKPEEVHEQLEQQQGSLDELTQGQQTDEVHRKPNQAERPECGWHQTGDCHWRGPREPAQDKGCDDVVPAGASGYCHCDGQVVARAGCNHGPFRCSEHCHTDSKGFAPQRNRKEDQWHRQLREQRQQEEQQERYHKALEQQRWASQQRGGYRNLRHPHMHPLNSMLW
jgi:hypothetical protein